VTGPSSSGLWLSGLWLSGLWLSGLWLSGLWLSGLWAVSSKLSLSCGHSYPCVPEQNNAGLNLGLDRERTQTGLDTVMLVTYYLVALQK
jgi:hypothetical protein